MNYLCSSCLSPIKNNDSFFCHDTLSFRFSYVKIKFMNNKLFIGPYEIVDPKNFILNSFLCQDCFNIKNIIT